VKDSEVSETLTPLNVRGWYFVFANRKTDFSGSFLTKRNLDLK